MTPEHMAPRTAHAAPDWPPGDSKLARMIRARDWADTGLGPIATWSDTLRTLVSSVLDSRFEMILLWGPQLLQIYNDAYARLMRDKHPTYLGRPTQDCWPEVWHFNAPIYERVMTQGDSVYLEDQPYRLQLDGGERVLSLSICYSPVRGPQGDILGVMVTLTDVSRRVQAEQALARDLQSMTRLNDLVARLVHAQDLDSALHEVLDAAISLMDADKGNIQLFDAKHRTLRIGAQRGFDEQFLRYFSEVDDAHESACGRALRLGQRVVIPDIKHESASSTLRQVASEAGYQAVQSTPLLGQNGSPMGMLSTHWRLPTQPSGHALRMLDLYARQAAQFIERSRIEHRLRQTAEELRQASRAKDEFIAMLGHELRNPLAPIQIALHLMEMRGDTASQRERAIIGRQVHHMTRLIDDLLDVARIIRGHVTLQPVPTELWQVVHRAVETASPLIEQRRHALALDVPPTGLRVMADPVRLAQVIANLLTNAARYTPQQGQIRVAAAPGDNGDVVLSVIDNGMGISSKDLERVFDLFTQGSQGLDRSQGGLGLGLTIARTMATIHGGTLTAHSEGPDQGSRFDLTLPLMPAEDPDSPGHSDTPAGTPRGLGLAVLVVDDNEDAAHLLSDLLQSWGYATLVAHDGPSALQMLGSRQVDLGLLDIGLPVMDGYELAQTIHRLPRQGDTPLVALSGYGQEQDRRRSRESGFCEHLVKPVDIERLAQLLEGLRQTVA
ncbi:MAG: ATP-binding protein [Aquabacterium sp.]|uniref:PAS domain-containing hybrid sensor histidine kinase/response regulator n=1 Tax=Aquabacterium sp. TaxID=1872578 RepID=UPI003BB130A9